MAEGKTDALQNMTDARGMYDDKSAKKNSTLLEKHRKLTNQHTAAAADAEERALEQVTHNKDARARLMSQGAWSDSIGADMAPPGCWYYFIHSE